MSVGEKQTFWSFISDDQIKRVEIPMIQRDYVQARNTPQVEFSRQKLLKEIAIALDKNGNIDLNYIYGKIMKGVFVPIDGQQRLTTLLLIHIYAFAKEGGVEELNLLLKKFLYETRVTTQRFLKELILHFPSFFQESEYADIYSYVCDAAWFSDSWLYDPSVLSFLVVLDEIHVLLKESKDVSMKLRKEMNITFMALSIENMGRENDLYIKMNSRGKSLSSFESFKSLLFQFIDVHFKEQFLDFKQKMDNEWYSMIFDGCGEKAFLICDTIFLNFLHLIVLNRVYMNDGYEPDMVSKLVNNKGFFNFDNYIPFLEDGVILNDIYNTFCFLEFLQKNDSKNFKFIFESLISIVENSEWSKRVILFAFTKYADMVLKWNLQSFYSWYRIIHNLVFNTQIDKEVLFRNACKSIDSFENDLFLDSETYFATSNSALNLDFFNRAQLKEESFKCQLILNDTSWREVIIEAEKHPYFKGEIMFVFKLLGDSLTIDYFQRVWKVITLLFNERGQVKEDNLFHRALLTYGNYAIRANSTNTFFFEGKQGYFNWRRMLREDGSFAIFKNFFDDFMKKVEKQEKIEDIMSSMVENYQDDSNEFLYYFIHYPALFDYMSENRYYECQGGNYQKRIILYSATRVSAMYVEFHTYILKILFDKHVKYRYGRGYFNEPDSLAGILSIDDNDMVIIYNNGYFFEDGTPVKLADGTLVDTVKKAILFIESIIGK